MRHVLLNTGHQRHLRPGDLPDDVLAIVRRWCQPGEHSLPFELGSMWLRLQVQDADRALLAAVYNGPARLAIIGAAADAMNCRKLWPHFQRHFFRLGIKPEQPRGVWCATLATNPLGRAEQWL